MTAAGVSGEPVTTPIKGPFNYEDYLLFPEDGRRHEIIEGNHYMTPSPGKLHQQIIRRLAVKLTNHVEKEGLGEVLFAPFDVVLSEQNVVQPDLLFVTKERLSLLTEKNLLGAPDLAVEVVSENTRKMDKKIKKFLYAHYGVREYWIIDPELCVVEVYRQNKRNELVKAVEYEESGQLESVIFPGLTIKVEELW